MANTWLRLYHDMPNDPKWRTIARVSKQPISVVLGVYVHLLTIASGAPERGTLDSFNTEDLATALDVDSGAIEAVLGAMQGRVLDGEKLSGWEKRQANREDSSTERVKRFRERNETHVTHGNAAKRNVTADKKREEEIRTKQEQATTSTIAPLGAVAKVHPDLEIYNAYPRKEGKGAAMTEINKAVARLAKGEVPNLPMTHLEAQRFLMRRVLEYARSPVGSQSDKTKLPHPATWFHQKRYDDDQANWQRMESGNGTYKGKSGHSVDAAKAAIEEIENSYASDGPWGEEAGEAGQGRLPDICG